MRADCALRGLVVSRDVCRVGVQVEPQEPCNTMDFTVMSG